MVKRKIKLQTIIFDGKFFNKRKIKEWVNRNGFVIDNRLRSPIMKFGNGFRVRQRNPSWFNKNTFKVESLGKGVKGVYGQIRI